MAKITSKGQVTIPEEYEVTDDVGVADDFKHIGWRSGADADVPAGRVVRRASLFKTVPQRLGGCHI